MWYLITGTEKSLISLKASGLSLGTFTNVFALFAFSVIYFGLKHYFAISSKMHTAPPALKPGFIAAIVGYALEKLVVTGVIVYASSGL